ncbi:MAG: hypothetical protein AAGE94_23490 [Acidobacteriota bacterium]
MTLHAFQQALSELVLSPDLRAEVVDRGTDALAAFDLDPREQRRVLSIAKQSGLGAGVLIHRSFRLSMIVRSLPGTCRLLGPRLSDLVHDYWREHLPLHYHFVWESCRFAGYLRGLVESETLAEPWLLDMLRIDLACMALQRGLNPEEVDLDPQSDGADLAEAATEDRLVVICHHDPRPLLADLDPDADGPFAPPSGQYRLVIRRQADGRLDFESI